MTPTKVISIILFWLSLAACSMNRGDQLAIPREHFVTHTVTLPGENLSLLAHWYTGNWKNWKFFFIPAYSGAVRKLKPGDQVLIPAQLAEKTFPPTSEFVQSHRPGTAVSAQKRKVITEERDKAEKEPPPPIEEEQEEVPVEDSPGDLESEFLNQMVIGPRE
jgi:hypothetical protein